MRLRALLLCGIPDDPIFSVKTVAGWQAASGGAAEY
jgi:hypothetical protein